MFRTEKDSFGTTQVPAKVLYGAQTQRGIEHFRIGSDIMPIYYLQILAALKGAAAQANTELREISAANGAAIQSAAYEIEHTEDPHFFTENFPVSVWQSGSGTVTNMNMNEVIANRASELMGGPRGEGRLVHPNDDVNRGQSTNDVAPTALNIAGSLLIKNKLIPALDALISTFNAKSAEFKDVIKVGRTHMQDAVPLTLGQEFSGYSAQLEMAKVAILSSSQLLHKLPIGGTAVGSGLNAHPRFGARVSEILSEKYSIDFACAENKFSAISGREAVAFTHGALKTLAAALTKIAGDIRFLACGPRAGIGEITIPENEPGSSIMPGKINPTQCEAAIMVGAQVLGNDTALAVACSGGVLELNTFQPLIVKCFLHSVEILEDTLVSFDKYCAAGIKANKKRITELLDKSLMLVTPLAKKIGYDKATKIADMAYKENITLREAALSLGYADEALLDECLDPSKMITQ